ncbi:helix-turn-helix domain-containing protein [Dyadobacter aurulentus]|uniref:helix-turn-helix domain-containing protein n=1 Tax=Dyadobacter sp. UC 10 TaxID=2605428 RepID=UPI0011F21F08|nr:helix-turn-helix transcriptional regulator [Dyadobacter sp. UC 10]KAA0991001.1 helix-turn-helix transcriptional regulator [Dyadobacter sp. UC 10]
MVTRKDLLSSPSYWLTNMQIEVFNLLNTYMEENNLTQRQVAEKLKVSPSYISQILNGNFNFTISKLVELALLVGKAPVIQFQSIEEIARVEENVQPKAQRSGKASSISNASKIIVR